MKNKLTLCLAILCAAQAGALFYLLTFTKPLKKDGGWWIFESTKDEILRCNLPDSRGYMVVRLFPEALSGIVYFQPTEMGGHSYTIDIGLDYVSTSTAYDSRESGKVLIVDKNGDGLPEFRSVKVGSEPILRKLSFHEEEN